ncbi:MAG TPA: ABC transporter permease subunit [Gemmataceae bacterium]|nr:ABC transporter permease subunit [Gemmataceae bacterium]
MSDSPHTSRPRRPPPVSARRRPPRARRERVRFRSRFTNALLGWEVLRAGRRTGTLAIARTALGGLLLAAMWALWAASFSGEQATMTGSGTEIGKKLNRFAESFAVTFFLVQATIVLLLTPVFVAGAIFEERETRSGEVLLTTELTRREVYIGKLGARMVQVLLVVLAGMPILFLTQLWGGVEMAMILVNYAATGIAIVGAGVVTAAVSAYAETLRGAILQTYGLLFLLNGVFLPASPYFVISMSAVHWGVAGVILIIYIPMQLVIVLVGYFIGQRWLRMAMLRQKTRLPTTLGLPPPLPGATGRRLPPLSDTADPLLWKELNLGGRVTLRDGLAAFTRAPGRAGVDDRLEEMGFARWIVASREVAAYTLRICAALVAVLLLGLTVANIIGTNWVVRAAGGLALCWLLCAVGLSAATGISRERQKHTLVDLLMLPGPRRDLLRAKVLGSLARGLWPGVTLVVLVGVGVLGFGVSAFSAALLLLTAAGLTLFSVAIGIWLSARCRTALNATATWIGVMAGTVIGTFLLAEANVDWVSEAGQPIRPDYPAWTRVLNPLLAWGRLTFRYDWFGGGYVWGTGTASWPIRFADLAPALVCPLLYAAAGGLLWLAAVRRFEKEGRS